MSLFWVVGARGMLGKAVVSAARRSRHQVHYMNPKDISQEAFLEFNPYVLINCAGVIPDKNKSASEMVYANSVLPLELAEACKQNEIKMVHVSTDCVFEGPIPSDSEWDNKARPNAHELYGLSKQTGEACVNLGATVVRTSFIGFEHGLLHWFLEEAHAGRPIKGYSEAWWTGSTVWEVARGLVDIAEKPRPGWIEHLSTSVHWNKLQVLERLNNLLELEADITPTKYPRINRSLRPTKALRDLADPFVSSELWEKYHAMSWANTTHPESTSIL